MLLWFFNLAVFSCHFFLAPFLALFLVHVPCCCFLLHYLLPVLAHVFVHLLTFVIFVSLRWLSPTHIRRQTNGLPLRRSKLHVFTSFFLVLSLPMYFLIRTLVLSLLISSFIIFLKSLRIPRAHVLLRTFVLSMLTLLLLFLTTFVVVADPAATASPPDRAPSGSASSPAASTSTPSPWQTPPPHLHSPPLPPPPPPPRGRSTTPTKETRLALQARRTFLAR